MFVLHPQHRSPVGLSDRISAGPRSWFAPRRGVYALVSLPLVVVATIAPMLAAQVRAQSSAAEQAAQSLDPMERARLIERLRQSEARASLHSAEEDTLDLRQIDDRIEPQALTQPLPTDSARAEIAVSGEGAVARPGPTVRPRLERFGQSLFGLPSETFDPARYGPVPADYRIGPGDELIVEVWGDVSFRDTYTVSREGGVLLRDAGRVTVAGSTLQSAKSEITRRLSSVLSGVKPEGGGSTFVEVTLGRLRAIRVFVIGEARLPGGYEVSSASTIFQALYAAGGPNDIGSMRQVQLIRDNRVRAELDLYDYLTRGVREGDVVLQEGDTVFIPVAERTIGVTGEVRRPGLYELEEGEGLREALGFAGGLSAGARADLVHVRRVLPPEQRHGKSVERVDLNLSLAPWFDPQAPNAALVDQDLVTALAVNPREEVFVSAGGSVVLPGRYGLDEGMRVSNLLEIAGGLWRDALGERAVLVRVRNDYTRESLPVDLVDLQPGSEQDHTLAPMDSLHVFSREVLVDEREVQVQGEVRRPGRYAFLDNMTVRDLLLAAGGLRESADPLQAEISRLDPEAPDQGQRLATLLRVPLGVGGSSEEASRFRLVNHDIVYVRKLPAWELQRTVRIEGEVKYPGQYTLLARDERLSSVIERAGGLLDSAYPPGFRLLRRKDDVGNLGLDLGHALRERGGPNDIMLAPGDEISIPATPNSVRVMGEVGFPTSIVWEEGRSIGDYLSLAGGYAQLADKGRTRVIYPNGTSKKVRRLWRDPIVLPGSTILVPTKDPRDDTDWGSVIKDTTAVLASLATIYLVIDATQN